jgi:peptidoglycan/xylan/chitin deacetylase (PgdA/CDA1 family)
MKRDPDLYAFDPYAGRPKITWPNGARIAVWVAPNVEFYEIDPPVNPSRAAWSRPSPDVLAYGERDYGNRAAHFRMLEIFDRFGIRGSVSLNVAMCDHHPEIVESCAERGWEFYSHGVYNTRYAYGMTEAQERAYIEDSIATIRERTGQTCDGWLAPALTHTERTLDLLAEYGIRYTCDLFHDDQPQPVRTRAGRMISVPYSLEMNDVIVYNVQNVAPRRYADLLKRCFDRLYLEGERSGTVMCIPLHAYLVGQPHRIGALEEAFRHIVGHDGVWLATGREIAAHYLEHHYDATVARQAAIEAEAAELRAKTERALSSVQGGPR